MSTNNQKEEVDVPKKKKRRYLKWLGLLICLTVGLIVLGTIYESSSEAADKKAYTPPGKMVDVGGYSLHINCTGSGNPTVVIESGWGGSSSSWGWVQPEVAKTTRVCTYDRAGMGWSEVSPEPRTAREFAKELHILLRNAKETGPYVLVGHSLGGYTVRVYAKDYPANVSGLVFVDPQNISNSDSSNFSPAPKPGRLPIPSLIAQVGLVRLLARPLGAVQNLPSGSKEAYTANSITPRSVQTFFDEGRGMSEGAAQARSVQTLGDLPLILLSRGKDMDPESAASQERYLKLSTINQHLIAKQSGHSIMIEQPDAVINAIVKMVELVRKNNIMINDENTSK